MTCPNDHEILWTCLDCGWKRQGFLELPPKPEPVAEAIAAWRKVPAEYRAEVVKQCERLGNDCYQAYGEAAALLRVLSGDE